jgi:hypothetical protein
MVPDNGYSFPWSLKWKNPMKSLLVTNILKYYNEIFNAMQLQIVSPIVVLIYCRTTNCAGQWSFRTGQCPWPAAYFQAWTFQSKITWRKATHQLLIHTRKNAQVVTNLQQTCSNAVPTTCQQDIFALLVPSLLTSCQRLVDNLLQGCWAQQTCYNLFQQLVIVLQFNNLSTLIK